MVKSKLMYAQRQKNIGAFRGCGFRCTYCQFWKPLRRVNCPKCKIFEPHEHLESFNQRPPRTGEGEFVTIGLSGDVSFASTPWMTRAIDYCKKWKDRTFLIQSKDPAKIAWLDWPSNVVIGTTIETNGSTIWTPDDPLKRRIDYADLSRAPPPEARKETLRVATKNDIAVTIEPIMDFDEDIFWYWMVELQPKWIWVGYDSGNHRLPEPELEKTENLIEYLRQNALVVHEKLMRKAWWEP